MLLQPYIHNYARPTSRQASGWPSEYGYIDSSIGLSISPYGDMYGHK
ncbi:Uncharacterised protein [Mycobacteroides abscessus subsp. abscessus]|nr:Uncharacterised protein [Mycobacteroides abscessus subsp. abscessus]